MKILLFLLLVTFGNGRETFSRNKAEEIRVGEYFDSEDSYVEASSSDSDSDSQVHWDDEVAVGDVWEEDLEDALSSPLLDLFAAHLKDDGEEVALGTDWHEDLVSVGPHPAQILEERGVGSRKEYLTRWEGERIPTWQTQDQLEGYDNKPPPALQDWFAKKRDDHQQRQSAVGEKEDDYYQDDRYSDDEYEDNARDDYDGLEEMVGAVLQEIVDDEFEEHRRSLYLRDMVLEAEKTLNDMEGPTADKDAQEKHDENETKLEAKAKRSSVKEVDRQEREAKKVKQKEREMEDDAKEKDKQTLKEDKEIEGDAEKEAKKAHDEAKEELDKARGQRDVTRKVEAEEKEQEKEDDEEANPTLKSVKKKLDKLRLVKDTAKRQSETIQQSGATDDIPGIIADFHEKLKSMALKDEDFKLNALRTKAKLERKHQSQERGRMKRLLNKLARARQEALDEHDREYEKRDKAITILKKAHNNLKAMVRDEPKKNKKKKKVDLENLDYSVDLPKSQRMALLSREKGDKLKAILRQLNLDDDFASHIFKVLNNREWDDHGMKKYLRLRRKKKELLGQLRELYQRRSQQSDAVTSKSTALFKALSKKLFAARAKRKVRKVRETANPLTSTIIIAPGDLSNPGIVHEKAQENIARHMRMHNVLSDVKPDHVKHLDRLRSEYPFIDQFFGEMGDMGMDDSNDSTVKKSKREKNKKQSSSSEEGSDEELEKEAKKEIKKRDEMKKAAMKSAAKQGKMKEKFFKGRKVIGANLIPGFTVKLPQNKSGLKKKRFTRFTMPAPKTRACVSSCCPCGFRRVRWSYKDGCYNVEGTCASCKDPAEKKLKAVGFSYQYNPAVKKTLPLFTFRRTGKEWHKNPHYKSKCPAGKVLTGLGTIVTKYEQKYKHSMRIKCASGTDPRLPEGTTTFESMP